MKGQKGYSIKQILVDMDGVLADVYSQFILRERDGYGIEIDVNTLNGRLESEAFPHYEIKDILFLTATQRCRFCNY